MGRSTARHAAQPCFLSWEQRCQACTHLRSAACYLMRSARHYLQRMHTPAGSLNTTIEVMRQYPEVFGTLAAFDLSNAVHTQSELPPDLGSVLPHLTTFVCWSCNLIGSIPAGKEWLAGRSGAAPVPGLWQPSQEQAVPINLPSKAIGAFEHRLVTMCCAQSGESLELFPTSTT